ncbi:MAG: ECF transporter S component [Clostridia bacterium]|nr:ECF transporter S component [Clostridia bacterium]
MSRHKLRGLVYAALFLAIGIVLPLFTGNIPYIGSSLLPMHIPVLLCGFICGGGWGAATGAALPILRFLLFGVPLTPVEAVAMCAELLVYGLVSGLIYGSSKTKSIAAIYIALITAMIVGRAVWGIAAKLLFLCFGGADLTISAFFTLAFANALPGIALQLIIIPAVVSATQVFSKSHGI